MGDKASTEQELESHEDVMVLIIDASKGKDQ